MHLPDIVIPKPSKPHKENVNIPYWQNYVPHDTLLAIYMPKIFTQDIFEPEYFTHQANQKNYDRYYLGRRILYPSQSRRVYKSYSTKYAIGYSALVKMTPGLIRQPGKVMARIRKQEAMPEDDIPDEEEVKHEIVK